MTHLPRSGPIRLDGRSVSPRIAVARVRALALRLRPPPPRPIELLVDHPAVVRAVAAWASSHHARCVVAGDVLRLFLFPADFGEPPAATVRELRSHAARGRELPWDPVADLGLQASASA